MRASLFATETDDDCNAGTSLGFNVERNTPGDDCHFNQPTDVLTGDQLLSAAGLDDNGGPTRTHALFFGPHTIEKVPAASCLGANAAPLTQDQRGAPRPDDADSNPAGDCEVGSYERVDCHGEPVDMVGTAGNDTLNGTGGVDVILGLGGDDVIDPGSGALDFVCAGGGNDRLVDNDLDSGSDELDGEGGSDTIDLSGLTSIVNDYTINLVTHDATGPGLGTDFPIGVESAIGSSGDDTLVGDGGPNVLDGSDFGADLITGGGGADALIGRNGNDMMFARDGVGDSVDCGSGITDTAQTDQLSLDSVVACEVVDALPEPPVLTPTPTAQPQPAAKKKCKKKKKSTAAAKKCKKRKKR